MIPSKECLLYLNHEESLTYHQIGLLYDRTKHAVYTWFKKREVAGQNNQVIVVPEHSKIADEKLRKYNIADYNGLATIIDSTDYQNCVSKVRFRCPCGNEFSRQFSFALVSPYGNVCKECKTKAIIHKYNSEEYREIFSQSHNKKIANTRSIPELEFEEFVRGIYPGEVISSFKSNGIEFDVYLPELNLAFEFNGLAFHSEMLHYVFNTKSLSQVKWVHYYKTKKAREAGIRLIHIFEDDWNLRRDIVILKIKSIIGCDDGCRVFARKCTIETVENAATRDFYDRTHIQGHVNASVSYGLFYGGMMVACMSFIKDGNSYVLVRYATSCSVVGGFSKLLKHFSRNHEYDSLISFADLSMVDRDNNVYAKTGWEVDGILEPDYKYIEGKVRKHKFLFRHKQLKTKLKNYDPNKSEYQNCLDHKLYRIWDCGKIRYRLDKA